MDINENEYRSIKENITDIEEYPVHVHGIISEMRTEDSKKPDGW